MKNRERPVKLKKMLNKYFLITIIVSAILLIALVVSFICEIAFDSQIATYVSFVFAVLALLVFNYVIYYSISKFYSLMNDGIVYDMLNGLNSLTSKSRNISFSKTNIEEVDVLKKRFVDTVNDFKEMEFVDRKVDESYLKFDYIDGYDELITRNSFLYNLPYLLKLNDYRRSALLLVRIVGGEVTDRIVDKCIDCIRKVFNTKTYIGRYSEDTLAVYVTDVENIKVFISVTTSLYEKFTALKATLVDTTVYSSKIGGAIYPFSSKDKILSDCEVALKGEANVNIYINKRLNLNKDTIESSEDNRRKRAILTERLTKFATENKKTDKVNNEVYENINQFAKYSGFETIGYVMKTSSNEYKCEYENGDSSVRLFKDRNEISTAEIDVIKKYIDSDNCFFSTRRDDLPSDLVELFDKHNLQAMFAMFFGEGNNIIGMSYFISALPHKTITNSDHALLSNELLCFNYIVMEVYNYSLIIQKEKDIEKIIKKNKLLQYTVNSSTYELTEMSDELKFFLKTNSLGKKCYEVIAKKKEPCQLCPLKNLKGSTTEAIKLFSKEYIRSILSTNTYLNNTSILLSRTDKTCDTWAYYDSATNLLSRLSFSLRLKELVDEKNKGSMIFIILQGVNKIIADYGEANLNKILAEMNDRILDCELTENVYRYSNNTLAVYFDEVSRVDCYDFVEKIHSALYDTTYTLDETIVQCNFKYVEINFSANVKTIDETYALINRGLNKANSLNDNTLSIAGEEIVRLASRRDYIINLLDYDYNTKAVEFNIQPIFALSNRHIVSGEILLRLFDANRQQFISPFEVVNIATETKKMGKFDSLNYENACDIYAKYGSGVFKIFGYKGFNINLSADTLNSLEWLHYIKNYIESNTIPSEYLTFEVSETILESSLDKIKLWTNELKGYGVRWSVDNYEDNSINPRDLAELHFNQVKISMDLLLKANSDSVSKGLYESIVAESHTYKIEVVAQGVEREQQLEYIKSVGVDFGQGYYLCRPLSLDPFIKLIEDSAKLKDEDAK